MLKRLILGILLWSIFVAGGNAAGATVVGVVTKIEPGAVEVRTDAGPTTSVALTPSTKYMKWIMAKPLMQDPRASAQFVKVGKRVRIEVLPDSPTTARTVWIVVGRPGFD